MVSLRTREMHREVEHCNNYDQRIDIAVLNIFRSHSFYNYFYCILFLFFIKI